MKVQEPAILVVEDDFNDQLLIRVAFKKINHKILVHIVNNGKEAIAYLNGEGEYADRERHPFPTTIITDLKMPVCDGFTVLEHIRDKPKWAVIPRVVLSASEDPDDIKKAYLLGAGAYHVKPDEPMELRRLLEAFYTYWAMVEMPERTREGCSVHTDSKGKLGERIPQPN
ncbi:MAG: response regulator receiver protein [Verrucomicrobiales bacterium]|nr:response regulator receiver protein [Verrucomicrobiales bacterium]